MKLKNELPLIAIVLLPYIYLAVIWSDLPEQVPLHWNIEGEIDRYGNKNEILLIPFLLPIVTYVIFLIVPKIDPKKKLDKMGNKLQNLKFLLTTFMSVLALFIIYSINEQSLINSNNFLLLGGVLYFILGNYFKTLKTNYFIGIRTPWTLEDETVWKTTHKLGGILWFIAGIVIVISSLILKFKTNFIFFMIMTAIITMVPFVYSYFKFQSIKKQVN
jgi:uncharacterized membrane protein